VPSDTAEEPDEPDGLPHARFGVGVGLEYALPAALGTLLLGAGVWELYAIVSGTITDRTGELPGVGDLLGAFLFSALGWALLLFVLGAVLHRTVADA
jgi:hypothetical protein